MTWTKSIFVKVSIFDTVSSYETYLQKHRLFQLTEVLMTNQFFHSHLFTFSSCFLYSMNHLKCYNIRIYEPCTACAQSLPLSLRHVHWYLSSMRPFLVFVYQSFYFVFSFSHGLIFCYAATFDRSFLFNQWWFILVFPLSATNALFPRLLKMN